MRLVGTKTDDETLLGIIGRPRLQKHPKIQKFTSTTPQLVALVMDVTSGKVQLVIVRDLGCYTVTAKNWAAWAATVLLGRPCCWSAGSAVCNVSVRTE